MTTKQNKTADKIASAHNRRVYYVVHQDGTLSLKMTRIREAGQHFRAVRERDKGGAPVSELWADLDGARERIA